MPEFKQFARAVEQKFNALAKGTLYVVDITKEEIWDGYMASFPEGTNKIFRERREYDCQTCKAFIRNLGAVVGITDKGIETIWDVETEGYYKDVAKYMNDLIKSKPIKTLYMTSESSYGAVNNTTVIDGKNYTFNHFYGKVPSNLVNRDYRSVLSVHEGNQQVFSRGLKEITREAIDTVLELIAQNSLYRGAEFKAAVQNFSKLKRDYDACNTTELQDIFVWKNIHANGARIRNTAIGTLLQDLSEGVKDLDNCVRAYEAVVAPSNYKRPTALVTKSMIDKALKTIDELGIEPALYRRHAKIEDISVNDVLFVDRKAAPKLQGVAGILGKAIPVNPKSLSKVEEIDIEDFIANVLPTAESLEVLLENKHSANLCNLIAPSDTEAKGIFKWGSNFSWSYNGNIADSMKQNVKAAGGNVDGVLRFSIQWNDDGKNENDLDAHCIEADGNEIYYGAKTGKLSGSLDVDIIRPGGKVAVENIIYTNKSKMKDGVYKFFVRNFNGTSGIGFTAEIEFNGEIHSYSYDKRTSGDMKVAEVTLKNGEFSIKHLMASSNTPKEIYGLNTQHFHKVNLVTLSPNFWNGAESGNKHYMFILDNCKNPDAVRGFYNEFLDNSLNEHRKVFEMLASKMQCEYNDEQLAGLGFSSTQRNELIVQVKGATQRMLKIVF